jgi:hypothetical protein
MCRQDNLFDRGHALEHLSSTIHAQGGEPTLHSGSFDRVGIESIDYLSSHLIVNKPKQVPTAI